MTLTSHLREASSSLRRYLRARYPGLQPRGALLRKELRKQKPLLSGLKPASRFSGLVGTAFEYRIRAAHQCLDPEEPMARQGLHYIEHFSPRPLRKLLPELQRMFQTSGQLLMSSPLASLHPEPRMEHQLARAALLLALLESYARAGLGAFHFEDSLSALLSDESQENVEEVSALANAHFHLRPYWKAMPQARQSLVPSHAGLVDGADADWVYEGVLTEFKTARDERRAQEHLEQALCYALLDADDTMGVRKLEVEYPRFGWIHSLDLQSDLPELRQQPTDLATERHALVRWLQQKRVPSVPAPDMTGASGPSAT